jgi:hypothetical protein
MASSSVSNMADKLSLLEKMVSKLEVSTAKKPRNVTEKGILKKAKQIYYQEMKEDDEVQNKLKARHGRTIKPSFKDWRMIAEVTDEMFEKLPESQKNEYLKRARSEKTSV